MKKLLFAIPLALLLCGCHDSTNLGSRAIIQAAALDYDRGEYTVSALLFSSGGGSDTVDASQENVIKVTGTGDTLGAAIEDLSLTDGKKILMSETKLLIFGGGFEEADVISAANTLYHDLRCSLNMPVCCAERASMLTDMHFTEGITSAEKPVEMIRNAYEKGVSPNATLMDILSDSAGGRSTLIPMFTQQQNGYGMTADENGKTAVLCGARFVSSGHLAEKTDPEETIGFMLLSGRADKMPLSFVYDGREYSCDASGIKTETLRVARSADVRVSAKLRSRSGAALPEGAQRTALEYLEELARKALFSGKG